MMKRQTFIKKAFWGLTGISVLSGAYTWQLEPFWLEFVRVNMPLKNLPDDLVGKTLMQISDIHIGHRVNQQFIIDAFNKAQKLNPDFVVYTGDYVSTHKDEILFDKLEETLQFMVKGTVATIAILGNHDYGKYWVEASTANKITEILKNKGVTVLRNEHATYGGLHFIGIDDFWGLNFNPKKAMKHLNKDEATIVLCHNPDVCDLDVWGSYDSWILSGHTHGGQVKPPFLPPFILPVKNKRYVSGQYALENDKTLYINRALGHSLQVRFNVRPEITIFTLQKQQPQKQDTLK